MDAASYLRFLPALYARRGPDGQPSFLERYLYVPEALLGRRDGSAADVQKGLAQAVDILSSLLYPRLSFLFPTSTAPLPPVEVKNRDGTPNDKATAANLRALNSWLGIVPPSATTDTDTAWEQTVLDWLSGFLDWLGGWLAFSGGADWSVDKQRSVLAGLMLLYRVRGTRQGLEGLLRLFFPADIRVVDLMGATPLVLGRNATVASSYTDGDAVLDGVRPFSFAVEISLPTYDFNAPEVLALQQAVRALVDAEKPLHTRYVLRMKTLTLTVGVNSTVGVDTLIPISEDSGGPDEPDADVLLPG